MQKYSKLPDLVKDVVMGIFRDPAMGQDFLRCLDVARHVLVRQGFLESGSESGNISDVRMTRKGLLRNVEHERKKSSDLDKFDEMAYRLEAQKQDAGSSQGQSDESAEPSKRMDIRPKPKEKLKPIKEQPRRQLGRTRILRKPKGRV
jgi:hypothetical protein